jgi:universal stress protein E
MSKILIIVDTEDKKQIALTRGTELAKAMGATIEIVAFTHEYLKAASVEPASQTKIKDYLIKDRTAWLKNELNKINCDGVKITSKVVWSKQLHQWINKRCQQQDYLAVVKTGHRSDTFYHTSTDWHLLRECPAPVLLIAEKKWRKARPILAALDLSSRKKSKQKLNQKILQTAALYASKFNRELHIVHALHISTVLQDLDLINSKALATERKAELKPTTEKICAEYGLGKQQIYIRTGEAHKVIPSVADKIKADLVVMGTVGHKGLAAHLLGNTAEKVLTHLRTDVLALKPPTK